MANCRKNPQSKMTPAHALKTAKRLALEGQIEIADATAAEKLTPWINHIVHALGLKRAMVTDQSRISDCLPRGLITPRATINDSNYKVVIQEECELISRTLGVPVAPHDTFVAVAERLRHNEIH